MRRNYCICLTLFLISLLLGFQLLNTFNTTSVMEDTTVVDFDQNNSRFFVFLSINNLLFCVVSLLALGVVTSILIIIQGIQMGAMFSLWVSSGNSALEYFILVAPHGILEIAAWLMFCALGLDLFLEVRKYLKGKEFNIKNWLKGNLQIIIVASVLVVVAAFVESYITPWIYREIFL